MREIAKSGDRVTAGLIMNHGIADGMPAPWATFNISCLDMNGEEKWREVVRNLVLTAGKTDIVDKYLKGSSYTAGWYVVLKGAGSIAAGDTLASHGGWTELTPYAGNRPAITWGTTSGGSNTSVATSISINAGATIAGAGMCNVDTGTSGVLYNMTDFSGTRTVQSGDTLNVTITITIS